ncbi:uncharacterized protein LOC114274585 [Camellia sinensis]|uniref:uncharacterized protein LOC114274585 n=1 Tax=Camellia sinensis TaxID=4442 RepID=UPI001035CF71|nr:uncharacterized protein LOC114274585 [Camellia sinensis]
MRNMVCFARSFRLQLVDVIIELHQCGGSKIPDSDHAAIHTHNTAGDKVPSELEMDNEADLLQSFCPHKEKVFLSAPWANGFTHIGQHFESGASEIHNVLRKYAVECGFQFRFVKNDSVRVTAICAMNDSKGCTWAIHARKLEANRFFYLRKWNSEHICGVAVRTSTNPLVGSELVADIIAERARDRPLTRPTEVILDLKQDYGLDIMYRVAWLGVEKSRGELFGAHSISFDQLRWYSTAVMEHNPGTYTNIEYDDYAHQFIRYFISFKACIDGFNHYQPLLFLDATFLKGQFKGFLLAATVKDGNQGIFLLAYVVVDSENTVNWSWGCRYCELCSNVAESFNSWVRGACNLPITRMVDSIRAKLMRQMAKCRLVDQTWTDTICPKMESRLEKAFNEGRSWKVSQSNEDVYEVHSFLSVTVDIGHRTCSCFKWQLNGFPCSHAMVVVQKSSRDLNTLVESYFHVSECRSTYDATIFPIPTVEKPPFNQHDYVIYPPVVKRPPGRPKKKRILLKGEQVQQIRCGRCGCMGNHNRKTCNEPI